MAHPTLQAATPEIALRLFRGWLPNVHRTGGLLLSDYPLGYPIPQPTSCAPGFSIPVTSKDSLASRMKDERKQTWSNHFLGCRPIFQ